jgi:hypothetical protein
MSAGTHCWVYNAAFSVVFVRTPGPFEIRSKAPCTTSGEWCDSFADGDAPVKQAFGATAPGKGKEEITFNGSTVCQSGNTKPEGVFLTTQIVVGNQTYASSSGPGGLGHYQRLEHAGPTNPVADTLDFSSTRILQFNAAGAKAVNFLTTANMFPQERCYLYNAGFSSLFVPE